MRAEDIVKQLWSVLPFYTDQFTDNFAVSSLTRVGTVATVVTSAPHLLAVGQNAFISGAFNSISVQSISRSGTVATVITNEDHDLTYYQPEVDLGYTPVVEISGANEPDYNGIHVLLDVPTRREFQYEIVATAPASATGTILLLQNGLDYNGIHKVVSVIDPVTFTYDVADSKSSPAEGSIVLKTNTRISAAVNADIGNESYTVQPPGKLWAFVVTGDRVANKSREPISDAIKVVGKGESYRQEVIQSFSIYCIFPATDSIAARSQKDDADSLTRSFTKSLLRLLLPTGFAEEPYSGIVFSGDRIISYNSAYYIHEYVFETTAWMTFDDTIDPEYSVAFRDVDLSFESSLNIAAGEIMTAKIDLDEQQLT